MARTVKTARTVKLSAALAAIWLAGCAPVNDAPVSSAPLPGHLALLDFDGLTLGTKIVGPVGPEVEASLIADGASLGDITSYVACPAGTTVCNPREAPAGTIFTFVHRVTPGQDAPNDPPFAFNGPVRPVTSAVRLRIVGSLNGFTGRAGVSQSQLRAAIGERGQAVVRCSGGALLFELSGEAANRWANGEPLTFFWQSRVPPAGPALAYAFDADGLMATGHGPSPAPGQPLPDSGC